MHKYISRFLDLISKINSRLHARCLSLLYGIPFNKSGSNAKIRGAEFISAGRNFSIGDNCWLEAVRCYAGIKYTPKIIIGDSVSLSDFVHISCAHKIVIGSGVLIGSKVYIGDHSHGSIKNFPNEASIAPALRSLGDFSLIHIRDNVWICDGVVVLAGSEIATNSIIAANSVVRLKVDRAALIAGVPAKVIRYLD